MFNSCLYSLFLYDVLEYTMLSGIFYGKIDDLKKLKLTLFSFFLPTKYI
jgi:hypothetical protein